MRKTKRNQAFHDTNTGTPPAPPWNGCSHQIMSSWTDSVNCYHEDRWFTSVLWQHNWAQDSAYLSAHHEATLKAWHFIDLQHRFCLPCWSHTWVELVLQTIFKVSLAEGTTLTANAYLVYVWNGIWNAVCPHNVNPATSLEAHLKNDHLPDPSP